MTQRLLPDNFAVKSINVFNENASIRNWRAPAFKVLLSTTQTVRSLYLMKGVLFLHWDNDVDVARVPIASNTEERIIYTGSLHGRPMITDYPTALGSGAGIPHPDVSYYAGIPAPVGKLVPSVTEEPASGIQFQYQIAGTVVAPGNTVTTTYTYRYRSAWGEVGPPSPPSELIAFSDTEFVTLIGFSGAPTGAYNITKMEIFRATSGGEYLYVDTIPISQTTYEDHKTVSEIGPDVLDSTTWDPPPIQLLGITEMANGILAGYVDNDLYFSEPYQGHAWPTDYIKTLDYPIRGLRSSGNYLFVETDNNAYVVVGNHPSVITTNKLKRSESIVSHRSLVEIEGGAMYASPNGLVLITPQGAQLISETIISRSFWDALKPETIHAVLYREQYVGFYDSGEITNIVLETGEIVPPKGAFFFNFKTEDIAFTDEYGTASHSELATGDLYFVKDADKGVYQWDADNTTKLLAEWRGRELTTDKQHTISSARIESDLYPVNFSLYVDRFIRVNNMAVANDKPFKLPSTFTGRYFSIEVQSTTSSIIAVQIADNIGELV